MADFTRDIGSRESNSLYKNERYGAARHPRLQHWSMRLLYSSCPPRHARKALCLGHKFQMQTDMLYRRETVVCGTIESLY